MPHDLAAPPQGVYPGEMKTWVHRMTCARICIAILFVASKRWRRPTSLSAGGRIIKVNGTALSDNTRQTDCRPSQRHSESQNPTSIWKKPDAKGAHRVIRLTWGSSSKLIHGGKKSEWYWPLGRWGQVGAGEEAFRGDCPASPLGLGSHRCVRLAQALYVHFISKGTEKDQAETRNSSECLCWGIQGKVS